MWMNLFKLMNYMMRIMWLEIYTDGRMYLNWWIVWWELCGWEYIQMDECMMRSVCGWRYFNWWMYDDSMWCYYSRWMYVCILHMDECMMRRIRKGILVSWSINVPCTWRNVWRILYVKEWKQIVMDVFMMNGVLKHLCI